MSPKNVRKPRPFPFFRVQAFRGTSVAMAALTFVGPVGPGPRTADQHWTTFGLGRHVSAAPWEATTTEKPFSTTGGGNGGSKGMGEG